MPNDYSVQIHNFLTTKLEALHQKKETCSTEKELAKIDGQCDEIHWLRQILKDNFDLKNHKYY